MRRILLALSLAGTAAGAARAGTLSLPETVAVKIAGLDHQAARAALRAAAGRVCRAAERDDRDTPSNCYNATLRAALDELARAEAAPSSPGGVQVSAR